MYKLYLKEIKYDKYFRKCEKINWKVMTGKYKFKGTLKVLQGKEGEKERIQIFEGVCIEKNTGSFFIHCTKSHGNYWKGLFVLPQLANELAKQGDGTVLNYTIWDKSGKSARISEKILTKRYGIENKKWWYKADKKAIDKSDTSNSANEKLSKASVNAESSKSKGISEDNYNEKQNNLMHWNNHIKKT